LQTCEDDILKMNEPILMQKGDRYKWCMGQGHEEINIWSQKVKVVWPQNTIFSLLISTDFNNYVLDRLNY